MADNFTPNNPQTGDKILAKHITDIENYIDALDSGTIKLGGGDIQFIQEQTVTGSAVQSITFSGLNGNTDVIYNLHAMIKLQHDAVLTTQLKLQFNGDGGTNYQSALYGIKGDGTLENENSPSRLVLHRAKTDNASGVRDFSCDIIIYASTNSIQNVRMVKVISQLHEGSSGNLISYSGAGLWNNNVDNMTSITLISSRANTINVGSLARLYKKTTGV